MAQLRDTCVHGILDADKYVISEYGYNVAKLDNNNNVIEYGDKSIKCNYVGKDVRINGTNKIDAEVHNNGIYINEFSCSMSVTDGFYTTYSSLVINKSGEAILYSNKKTSINGKKLNLNGQLEISDKNYGTQNPSDAITNPEIGNIYFKIIS